MGDRYDGSVGRRTVVPGVDTRGIRSSFPETWTRPVRLCFRALLRDVDETRTRMPPRRIRDPYTSASTPSTGPSSRTRVPPYLLVCLVPWIPTWSLFSPRGITTRVESLTTFQTTRRIEMWLFTFATIHLVRYRPLKLRHYGDSSKTSINSYVPRPKIRDTGESWRIDALTSKGDVLRWFCLGPLLV